MKVVFGSIITEGHGKLGGAIVQQSYGGYQMRSLKQPLKKPSNQQSRNRVNWKNITGIWRSLSSEERQTWIDNAPLGTSGFQLFNQTNMVMIGMDLNIITEYQVPITPPEINIEFDSATIDSIPPKSLVLVFTSPDSSIPVTEWYPRVLWSRIIAPGVSFNPPINRLVSKEGFISYNNDSLTITVGSEDRANMENFVTGSRAIFYIDFLNAVTGQILNSIQYYFTYA